MTVRGKVKRGKVLLDDPKALPDGAEVEVRVVKRKSTPTRSIAKKQASRRRKPKPPLRPLSERLAPIIGMVKNLPPDMSVNLDHYLYGHPKKK